MAWAGRPQPMPRKIKTPTQARIRGVISRPPRAMTTCKSNRWPREPVRGWCLLVLACWAVFASASTAFARHRALLPQPRQIHYAEDGTLPVQGLSIRFASQPSPEDRFAAGQLASRLEAVSHAVIPVGEGGSSGLCIVLHRTGDGAALPGDADKPGPDSREAYFLKITTGGVEIRAASSAGLFYGVQTLLQMVEGEGVRAVLPAAEIHDWPALAYRGVMMDFSEGELVKMSEVERQLDLLARFKANQYYFYSEANIAYEGYEAVNASGRYTKGDVRHVIAYARERHIDVVPCLELYGHMHALFRHEQFADLALPRYGGEYDPRNPRIYAVLDDWIAQTAALFPSPWFHVGFDEPWSLGKIGTVPGQDPFKAFMGVLRHVSAQAGRHGKSIMFWADIKQGASTLSNHPDLLREVPGGAIAVPWVYDAKDDYTSFVAPLAEHNIPTVIAPGIWGWNEIFPDYHRSFANINGLAATGRKFGTLGMLNTTWADSKQTIYRLTLPGMAFGATAAWQDHPVDPRTFFNDYCDQVYPTEIASNMATVLEDLSSAEEIFERVMKSPTQTGFWADPLDPGLLKQLQAGQAELRKARLLAEDAQVRLRKARRVSSDPTLPSLLVASRMFDYLGMKTLYAVEWADYFRQLREDPRRDLATLYIRFQIIAPTNGMLTDLQETIADLRGDYRRAWLDEAAPYRLQNALYRWDAEWNYWAAVRRLVTDKVWRGWKPGQPFPSIAVIRPARD